jgi:hypothetical protein
MEDVVENDDSLEENVSKQNNALTTLIQRIENSKKVDTREEDFERALEKIRANIDLNIV